MPVSIVPVLLRIALLLLILVVLPRPGGAQQFNPENRRAGNLEIRTLARPYVIQGNTPQEIYDGLRRHGQQWMTFESNYLWGFTPRDMGGGFCRAEEFVLDVDLRITYPRWDVPADADPRLMEAWEALVEQMRARWDERVDLERALLRRLERRMRSVRDPCDHVWDMVERYVDDEFEKESEDRIEAYRAGERVVLRWPPPSFGDLEVTDAPVPPPPAAPRASDPESAPAPRIVDPPPGDGGPTEDSPLYGIPDLPADFQQALSQDFDRPHVETAAMVLGIVREGEILGIQPVGTDPATGDAPSAEALFALPGLTEVFLGVLANALDRAGVVDVDAPIGSRLTGLGERLGAVTVRQLLEHRAGLDNAAPPDGSTVAEAVDALTDQALFTDPGSVFSYSRYSYPLLARVLEAALSRPLEDLLRASILIPAGMSATAFGGEGVNPGWTAPGMAELDPATGLPVEGWDPGGLPVVFTTVPDVSRFLAQLATEDGLGVDVDELLSRAGSRGGRWGWSGGLWWARSADQPVAVLACSPGVYGVSAGFTILPAVQTGVVLWATDIWPHQSARFILDSSVQGLPVEPDPYPLPGPAAPARVETGTWTRCSYPDDVAEMVQWSGAGEPVEEPGRWTGVYANGDRLVELSPVDGGLAWTGGGPGVEVRSVDDRLHVAVDPDGRIAFRLRLFRDGAGRRYVMVRDRAYLHREDAGS